MKRSFVVVWGLIAALASSWGATPANASPGLQYVALGDSYSSGPGSGYVPGQLFEDESVYEPGTAHRCNRSARAYPSLLASTRKLSLRNVSCAGASVPEVLRTGQHGEPAQIQAVTASTRLVTLTLGGNDIGFGAISRCIVLTECTSASPAIVQAHARLAELPAELGAVYAEIRRRAPAAAIVVAGYPHVFPGGGQPAPGCALWLSPGEQTVFAQIQDKLGAAIAAAVRRAGPNIRYLDPFAAGSAFDSPDAKAGACAVSGGQMMNGIRPDFFDGALHPNALGQAAYLRMFNDAVR